MTVPYKQLREALEAGPTDGPWDVWNDQVLDSEECPIAEVNTSGFQGALPYNSIDATYIAAANPQTITALLSSHDAQAAEIERLREALKELVACKSIKESIALQQAVMVVETDEEFKELDRLMTDYAKRQPVAWHTARRVLGQGEQS